MKFSNRSIPLYIPISVLFILVVFTSCTSIAVFTYLKSKHMVETGMEKLLTRVISETTRELVAAMEPPAAMVRLSSTEENIIHAANLTERLRSLNYMKESLLAVDALDSIYVGYPDGDYFLLRRVRSSEDLEIFKAPEDSKWIVQSVERTDDGREEKREFLYFGNNLNILARQDYVGSKSFAPRLRPWYQQAVESRTVVRSDPYVFFYLQKNWYYFFQKCRDSTRGGGWC